MEHTAWTEQKSKISGLCRLSDQSLIDRSRTVRCSVALLFAEGAKLPVVSDGFTVWGIDASPSLIATYRRHLPDMPAACEPAQDSAFFGRTFVGAVSIGLIFLLYADDQRKLVGNVERVLEPGGRFLFSAPREVYEWRDPLTGHASISMGDERYAAHLARVGLNLTHCHSDEGGNNSHEAAKPTNRAVI